MTYRDNAFAGEFGARIELGFSDHTFAFGDGTARNALLTMTVDGGSLDADFGNYTGENGSLELNIRRLDDAPIDINFGDCARRGALQR